MNENIKASTINGSRTMTPKNSPKSPGNYDPAAYFNILPLVEKLLDEYNPDIRREDNIFFTPLPVVSFITRSIHSILKKKLDKALGLADHTVKILDPAAGTATFLITAAHLAFQEMFRKYGKENSLPFIRHFLLHNLYGIEKEMSLFAVSCLNFAHLSRTLNLKLLYNERFPLYWSDSLAYGVGDIPFNVILGNPPYCGHSTHRSKWISEKIKTYHPNLQPRKPGRPTPSIPPLFKEKNLKWLQDDYVKFSRLAQEKIDEYGEGVVGYITNNAYLDNPTFREMRKSLMMSFNEIYILNLHGSSRKKEKSPDGSPDENVFDIRQGVAITFFIKMKKQGKGKRKGCKVFYSDLWGLREVKYGVLDSGDIESIEWKRIFPGPGFYNFTAVSITGGTGRTATKGNRYREFFSVTDIFPEYSVGIVTARDSLTIKATREEMIDTVKQFIALDETTARLKFGLSDDSRDWQVKEAQRDLRESGIDPGKVVPILYRPFDTRFTYYTGKSRGFLCMPRPGIMGHLLKENLGLITVRQVSDGDFNHCFVADTIVDSRVTMCHRGIGYVFPLYLYGKPGRTENIADHFRQGLAAQLGGDIKPTGEEIFYYIYAFLYSNVYRKDFAEQLREDFPRIPFPTNKSFFNEMSRWGEKLVSIHLLKSSELKGDMGVYTDKNGNFSNLPPRLWEYKIGGYPILQKLLKGFTEGKITSAEVGPMSRVIMAIDLTIRYQERIGRLIRKYNLVSLWRSPTASSLRNCE